MRKEHSNLYYIFHKDKEDHPMPEPRLQMLLVLLKKQLYPPKKARTGCIEQAK